VTTYGEFQFKDYRFNPASGELKLSYAFASGPSFEELITFPKPLRELSAPEEQALDSAFRLIFLLAGVSYYKAALPSRLTCLAFELDGELAAFCTDVYRHGLGELAYRNKVKLDINFKVQAASAPIAALPLNLPQKLLVPVGGGKDSIVTIEALKRAGQDVTLFALGGQNLATPIAQTIAVSGLPHLAVKRTISPALIELNRQGALNGHVPITAILSAIATACAILYGFDAVVLSNENSANAPNVMWEGEAINHQYSKSFAFEQDFSRIVRRRIAADLAYFSLLRPLTETAIAARFAKLDAYHAVFRSCNTAFRQDEAARGTHWCCDCPKCRFVFLALAPFMPKEKLVAIFGRNLLDDPAQTEGFKELCGLSAIKPFECVGEVEESCALLAALAARDEWKQDSVVAALAPALITPVALASLFDLREGHQLSDAYLKVLHEV